MQALASATIVEQHRHVAMLLKIYSGIDNGVTAMLPSVIERAGLSNLTKVKVKRAYFFRQFLPFYGLALLF